MTTSILTRIDPDFKIPYDEAAILSGDPKRLAAYFLEFAETLQLVLRKLSDRANFAIDLADGAAVYYALPNEDGDYPVDTWRTIQVGDNLEDQIQLTAGTWTTAFTRERPV